MRPLVTALALLMLAAPANAAEITVTTHADVVSKDFDCSLREAISSANTDTAVGDCTSGSVGGDPDVIRLDSGLYLLRLDGAREDDNATGDLDVTGVVTIVGRGTGTTISSAGIDRVLDVAAGAEVRVQALTVAFGAAPNGLDATDATSPGGPGESGGGIRSAGSLSVVDAAVTNNRAGTGGAGFTDFLASAGGPGGSGGGISATGDLTLARSVVADNAAGAGGPAGKRNGGAGPAGGGGGSGGGIAATDIADIVASRIERNAAGDGGPGTGDCFAPGGPGGRGGGIDAQQLTLRQTTVATNRAGAGGRGTNGSDLCGSTAGAGGHGGSGGGVAAVSAPGWASVLVTDNTAGDGGRGGNANVTGGAGGSGGSGGGLLVDAAATLAHVTIVNGAVGAGAAGGSGANAGAAGATGTGAAMAGTTDAHVARSILDGTCSGAIADDGVNLRRASSGCPGTSANLQIGAGGVPRAGSPAIDGAATAGCPATDVQGRRRPQGVRCDIGAVEVVAAALSLSRTALAFGTRVGTQTVTVGNPGLPGQALPIALTGGPDFTLAAETCPSVLVGGASCTVTVGFAPTRPGARTGTLRVGGRSIVLTGTGPEPCVVPRLKGKTVKKARTALRHAHCTLGAVTRRGRGRPGRIRTSKPKAGSVLAAGAAVDVVVNRRRARPRR